MNVATAAARDRGAPLLRLTRGVVLWDGRLLLGSPRPNLSVRLLPMGRAAQNLLLAGSHQATRRRYCPRPPGVSRAQICRASLLRSRLARASRSGQAHRHRPRQTPAGTVSSRSVRAGAVAGSGTCLRRAHWCRHGAVLLPAAHDLHRGTRAGSLRHLAAGAVRTDEAIQRRGQHPALYREVSGAHVRPVPDVGPRWRCARATPGIRRNASPAAMGAARSWLDEHPDRVVALLEMLKDDPASLVRRSVANNLNDLGKVHPSLLIQTCESWLGGASPNGAPSSSTHFEAR